MTLSTGFVTVSLMSEEPVSIEDVLDRWRAEAQLERELVGVEDDGAPGSDQRWVTLAEAEALAGVSRSTLRAWYRSGQIPARVAPGKHGAQRLVPLDVVAERARRSSRIGAKQPDAGGGERVLSGASSPDAIVRLAELAAAQAADRAKAAEDRAAAAEAALRDALERAAAAEAEVRLLRERLDNA